MVVPLRQLLESGEGPRLLESYFLVIESLLIEEIEEAFDASSLIPVEVHRRDPEQRFQHAVQEEHRQRRELLLQQLLGNLLG